MKFLAGMFGHRKATPPAETPTPKPELLSPEAVARLRREQEEPKQVEQQKLESAAEIERAVREAGVWWPGQSTPPERRLSSRSWRSRIKTLIGG